MSFTQNTAEWLNFHFTCLALLLSHFIVDAIFTTAQRNGISIFLSSLTSLGQHKWLHSGFKAFLFYEGQFRSKLPSIMPNIQQCRFLKVVGTGAAMFAHTINVHQMLNTLLCKDLHKFREPAKMLGMPAFVHKNVPMGRFLHLCRCAPPRLLRKDCKMFAQSLTLSPLLFGTVYFTTTCHFTLILLKDFQLPN